MMNLDTEKIPSKSSIYSTDQKFKFSFNKISGKELSYNNYNDVYAG